MSALRILRAASAASAAGVSSCLRALVRLRHRDGEALRKKVVARVAGGDANLVGFTAEADDAVGEDNFSFCHTKIYL